MAQPYGPATPKAKPKLGLSRIGFPGAAKTLPSTGTAPVTPSLERPPAEPLWEPASLQPEPQSLNIILGCREPLKAPVAGGDLTAHHLTNSACLCTATDEDTRLLCEQ